MISLPSFAKINLGLKIGARRPDGFHELCTVYQTLALHDVIRAEVAAGSGIEVRCDDRRVPLDGTNTCYKVAERVLTAIQDEEVVGGPGEPQIPRLRREGGGSARDDKSKGTAGSAPGGASLKSRVVIEIEKHLPVQGGMGAASSNAVMTLLGMERALGIELSAVERQRIAAEVGSDLPLFLVGGTVLGLGRGELVYALPDLPELHLVVVTPAVGVSTPRAFARWDEMAAQSKLTRSEAAGTINVFSQRVLDWLSKTVPQAGPASGVPAGGGDRAETPLLDLVQTGIENDFERVVFPEHPELREVKELLQREGAQFASLSGSGSTLYGVFASVEEASAAAERMRVAGHAAIATTSLSREAYWRAVGTAPP
jgi:4-diphosphocytidyl-2-C-methyl-D-erythritol kinase